MDVYEAPLPTRRAKNRNFKLCRGSLFYTFKPLIIKQLKTSLYGIFLLKKMSYVQSLVTNILTTRLVKEPMNLNMLLVFYEKMNFNIL